MVVVYKDYNGCRNITSYYPYFFESKLNKTSYGKVNWIYQLVA